MDNQVISRVEAESSDLALHTELCALRYNQLIAKLDVVDHRLDRIDAVCESIRENIVKIQNNNYNRYLAWAGAAIAILVSALIAIVVK